MSSPADRIQPSGGAAPRSTANSLRDLILIQIMFVVGSGWVGTAAKLGTAHLAFWLAAAAFYLPQAAVVIFLSRILPLEGVISGRPSVRAAGSSWVGTCGRSRF